MNLTCFGNNGRLFPKKETKMSGGPLILRKNPQADKLAAIKAAREAAATQPQATTLTKWLPAGEASERLRIIADDSGSMTSRVADVREGVIEFFRNCIPNQTSAAVHFLCTPDEKNPMSVLNSNLLELASLMKVARFGMGGTPLFSTLLRVLDASPGATRLICFTDGSPTDHISTEPALSWEERALLAFPEQRDAAVIVAHAKERHIPIDTIFFGEELGNSSEIKLLKYLASETGGYFMVFDPSKVSFKSALKYLSSGLRLMLASESVRKEIEAGKRS